MGNDFSILGKLWKGHPKLGWNFSFHRLAIWKEKLVWVSQNGFCFDIFKKLQFNFDLYFIVFTKTSSYVDVEKHNFSCRKCPNGMFQQFQNIFQNFFWSSKFVQTNPVPETVCWNKSAFSNGKKIFSGKFPNQLCYHISWDMTVFSCAP